MTFVAALPILLALILLVGFRWPASRAMPVCASATLACGYFFWEMPALRITASIVEAVAVTISILLIVFGALFFLNILKQTGAIAVLQNSVAGLSNDRRIQAVIVGWTLGSFLEGSAGFGTPAAITAPLLIGLGFHPLQAVVIALLGDSTAVSFGAIGTPMIIGFGQGLGEVESAPAIAEVARKIATFDLLLGTLMPAILLSVYVFGSEGLKAWRTAVVAIPFACTVGFAQALTSWIVVAQLGPEFPSLIGPIAGFATAVFLLKTKWLIPAEEPVSRDPAVAVVELETSSITPVETLPSAKVAFLPYLMLIVLLVVTRARALPFGAWLADMELGFSNLFDTGISASLQPLYSPGTVFLLCGGLSLLLFKASKKELGSAAGAAGQVTLKTSLALIAAIITVRVFLQSGGNQAGLEAMPLVLAEALSERLGGFWPAVAPVLGALGSFISGSATFSNMLFALLQLEVATELNYQPSQILALQSVGSAAGNMTCIHNVVAACAVAGILGQEGNVIRRTAIPMIIYLIVAGALGILTAFLF